MHSKSQYRIFSLFIFLLFFLVSGSILADGNPKGKIQPFNLEGVRLLEGRLKTQFEQVKDFYLSLRPNDILKGFRERKGENAPGKELGGAHSQSALGFGQWIGAFARMYKVTGEEAIREKAIYLMDEWGKTIDEDGFFGYRSPPHNPGHYIYDKMVGGLVDIYEYIGNERALDYLSKITGWAEKNLDRSNPYALPTEWYTLSENLYRAYELTGEKRYYDFAKVWEYTDFWGILARNESVFQEILKSNPRHESYHGYSHVNCLSSAAMAYRITGEEHYLQTIKNAYIFLQNTQCYATGGYGPEEGFVVPNGMPETLVGVRRGESNVNIRFHFETSCGSWAGFKLSRYLMSFTGDAVYGDWIESLVYNGVGAMIPMNDYGMIQYGSKYHLYGAQKSLFTIWFCCQGSLPQTVTDYHNLIYFKDKENLYINLYIPSQVDWKGPDGLVTLIQETDFPEKEIVNIKVEVQKPSQFGLKFRVPSWAHTGVKIMVNHEPYETSTKPGEWAVIKRKWSFNDKVTLKFDLSPRIEPLPGYVSPVAVLCGPVVMVRSTARENEDRIPVEGDLKFPSDWLMGEDPLIAYTSSESMKANVDPKRNLHTNQMMRPYYDLKSGEYYRMYFERAGSKFVMPDQLTFQGNWQTEGNCRSTNEIGSSFEGTFEGSTLVWEGLRKNDAGIAQVSIDGNIVAEADQYGYTDVHVGRLDQREVPFRWSISNLGSGKHSLTVKVLSNKNQASKGNKINLSRLIVYP
jgi:DUF1680 family protein